MRLLSSVRSGILVPNTHYPPKTRPKGYIMCILNPKLNEGFFLIFSPQFCFDLKNMMNNNLDISSCEIQPIFILCDLTNFFFCYFSILCDLTIFFAIFPFCVIWRIFLLFSILCDLTKKNLWKFFFAIFQFWVISRFFILPRINLGILYFGYYPSPSLYTQTQPRA